jgi:hypothetical protein
MVAQTDPRGSSIDGAGFRGKLMQAPPDGRIKTCPPMTATGPRHGLIAGLALGALLWLGIGVFAWQFFR